MASYLDTILEATRQRVARDKRRRSQADFDRDADHMPAPRDFAAAVRAEGLSLIAEFKRRSPSKGQIRADLEPNRAAELYELGGARAMSVLTEPEFFSGSMDDLYGARRACGLPVLRKDFMIDPYQVTEARVGHADAILLIAAALEDRGLFREMLAAAEHYGVVALIEVHDRAELEAVLPLEPDLLGVNQRNLTTFEVDTSLAVGLRPAIPAHTAMVCESGITSRAQVAELQQAGVDAILVGETLMRAEDPAAAARELLGAQVD
ncbi:MAG: indole-3-glycerol phosphate synthase TrpC [Actinomycetota bacterium]